MKYNAIILTLIMSFCFISCDQGNNEKKSIEDDPTVSTNSENIESNNTDDKVAATVNDSKILKSEIDPSKDDSLERAILDEVLYHAALKEGVDKKFEEKIQRYRKSLLASYMTTNFFESYETENLDEYDIEKYYNDNISNYTILQLGIIIADSEELANQIHQEMMNGDTFVEAKEKHKKNKSVKFRVKKENLKANNLKEIEPRKGFISKVIPAKDKDKFRIYKVLNIKKIEFDKVKNAIRSSLYSQERHKALIDYSDELKKKYNISVQINE